MEQLTEQEERKQRRIYKWCMTVFALEGILLVGIAAASVIFRGSQTAPKIAFFTLFGSFIPVLIALRLLPRLQITRRVEVSVPTLPYKLGREKDVYYIFGGSLLVVSIMMIPMILEDKPVAIARNISLPTWVGLPLFIWLPFGLLFLLVCWRGIILFDDHLCLYHGWIKQNVPYRDMKRAEITRKAVGNGARAYVLAIHHDGNITTPLEIYLASVPGKDCAIMLNVIQMHSPHVVMNDLALQIKQGEIPMA